MGNKQEPLEEEGEEEEEGEVPLEKGQRGACAGACPCLQRSLGSQQATLRRTSQRMRTLREEKRKPHFARCHAQPSAAWVAS